MMENFIYFDAVRCGVYLEK